MNNKWYIGQTVNYKKRKRDHLLCLNKNKHYNKHLQRAWNKYGKEKFEWVVLEEVRNKEILNEAEEKWIKEKNSFKNGYNQTTGGESPQYSDEIKKKKSEIMCGKRNHMWGKFGEKHHSYGKKYDENVRKKMSDAHKGKSLSEEHKKNIGKALKGRSVSQKTKEKIRKANSGEKCGTAKLTWKQVKEIRKLYKTGNHSQYELANYFDITRSAVQNIVENKRWKDKNYKYIPKYSKEQ